MGSGGLFSFCGLPSSEGSVGVGKGKLKKANKTSQHTRKQASFCSMHKRYQYSFLNQNSARILNNTKTSKRKLSNSLILTKLFKSLLCSVALFGVVGVFGFFLRGHE